jgi:isoleucyl-tRNA synthetase
VSSGLEISIIFANFFSHVNSMLYPEYKHLNLPAISDEVLRWWEENQIFEKSVSTREGAPSFNFYEGPPSANGLPGIHHVMARTIKDMFCRYKTLRGYQVKRKAGWDTHGLPVELGVEKNLGITKEDIGKKLTIEEYNQACREDVMKFTGIWNDLTRQMGYWVDMENPYVTYDNKYIESVWWLLKRLFDKGLLYKGYTIQPYSPAAGTGLSSHELNMPGTYKDVKDSTIVAQFSLVKNEKAQAVFGASIDEPISFLAWTTTPWTLPSNTALTVGKNIQYVLVKSFNPYVHTPVCVILAKDLMGKYFSDKNAELPFGEYKPGDKAIPFEVLGEFSGAELEGLRYEQLLPFAQPTDGDAFKVITGDFVTTEDGTGIVHTAPSFGADDFKVARQHGIGSLTLVDLQGRFVAEVNDTVFGFAGEYVKEQYLNEDEKQQQLALQQERLRHIIPALDKYLSVDERIALKLKTEGKAFKIEKYEHTYPHCWRTDKPILYYPLDSWFVKSTAAKDRLIELNKTIGWRPESTGTGRFGNWLENLQDWNLSRSRYWGIPLPLWSTEDHAETICIGSVEQLYNEATKAVEAGLMAEHPLKGFVAGDMSNENYTKFDLHRPYADDIILLSPSGKPMRRESDLIDVWFDSGAMPYAQHHFPFENREFYPFADVDGDGKPAASAENSLFPADFIAEGVDQTRGWFFTLHAISVMCFDSIAFKNVVSNGLVLDKNGNKMSKRLGNATDPFVTLPQYGADATRWYMIGNAQPWDNLRFNEDGIAEVQRKFFGTLYNTYNFFAMYANIDGYKPSRTNAIPLAERSALDRWILSRLNSLVKLCTERYDDYDPTPAVRAIEDFVQEQLSNWYVRLGRRRFWKSESSSDKQAAYDTLFECLRVVAQLMSPVAPFFGDWLYRNLRNSLVETGFAGYPELEAESVHLSKWQTVQTALIDEMAEERMEMAQRITSMVLSLRKKSNIRVRQPLSKIMVPVMDARIREQLEEVKLLILNETNVKHLEYVGEDAEMIVKKIRPDFKALGPKFGKMMKEAAARLQQFSAAEINELQRNGEIALVLNGETVMVSRADVEILTEDIPGWLVAAEGAYTVALDVTISEQLKEEGLARELVNKIQNLRKTTGLEVTDRIDIIVKNHPELTAAVENNKAYICAETLGNTLELLSVEQISGGVEVELTEELTTEIAISKTN